MLYLFHGKNSYLSHEQAKSAIERIKNKRVEKGKIVDLIIADASTQDLERIINEVETPSFLSTHKIIFVKRPSQNKKKDDIQEWIIGLTESSNKIKDLDLLVWEDHKLRSNTRIVKAFKKEDKVYESPELNKRTFITWAKDQISDEKFKIKSDALYLLSQRSNFEPERFFHELQKVKLMGKEEITVDDIEKISPNTLEHTIWELIDDLNDGKKGDVGEKLNELIAQGNDPHFILSMLTRNLRIILMTKKLDESGMSSSEISKKIGTHPFVISKIKGKAQKMKFEKIKKMYEKLTGIDYSTKTGQIDIELALNLLVSVI